MEYAGRVNSTGFLAVDASQRNSAPRENWPAITAPIHDFVCRIRFIPSSNRDTYPPVLPALN